MLRTSSQSLSWDVGAESRSIGPPIYFHPSGSGVATHGDVAVKEQGNLKRIPDGSRIAAPTEDATWPGADLALSSGSTGFALCRGDYKAPFL